MSVQVKTEMDAGDRRTITIPCFVWQNDGATALTFPAALTAMSTYAATTFKVPPRTWSFRRLSKFSYRFFLEYSTHAFQQDTETPENEVLEFPRLYLPTATELIQPLERIRGSSGASGSNPEGRFLIAANAGKALADWEPKLVELPKQNTTFTVDIPTEAKYTAFLAAIKKCHGKLNDDVFRGHPAGCVMILTAAPISPPGEIPRIDIGAAVGAPADITRNGQTLEDVLPFSWLGLTLAGEPYGIVAPRDSAGSEIFTVEGIHELRVFEEAEYDALDLPEPA